MPIYLYQHPKTKKVVEVIQRMTEAHEYAEKGIKFARIYTVPQGVVDGHMNCFSENAFLEKTYKTKGSMGDIWDRSRDLSEERKSKAGGVDPVKEKFYQEYSKKRRGKPHPSQFADKTYTI